MPKPPPTLASSGVEQDLAFGEAWREVRARFPQAADYRLDAAPSDGVQALLAWARPDETSTVYGLDCRPARVKAVEDGLVGRVHEQVDQKGNEKTVRFEELHLGVEAWKTHGEVESFERRGSEWVSAGSGGLGGVRRIAFGLSQVTRDAAWYNAVRVRLAIACTTIFEEDVACANGVVGQCARCVEWGLRASSLELKYGIGAPVRVARGPRRDGVDCQREPPCDRAAYGLPTELAWLQKALSGATFVAEGPEVHPLVFRTREACAAYRRQHVLAPDVTTRW